MLNANATQVAAPMSIRDRIFHIYLAIILTGIVSQYQKRPFLLQQIVGNYAENIYYEFIIKY